ncbi:MAG: hypothetical protein AAF802_08670 [Planctomycetota bacterium]
MQSVLKIGQLLIAAGAVFTASLGQTTRCFADETWQSTNDRPVIFYMEECELGDTDVPLASFAGVTSEQDLFDYVTQMDSLEYAQCQGGIMVFRWIDDRSDQKAQEQSFGSSSLKLIFGTGIALIDGPLPFGDAIAAGLILDGMVDLAESIDDAFSGTGSGGDGEESGSGGEKGGDSGGSGGSDTGDTGDTGGGGSGGSGDGG